MAAPMRWWAVPLGIFSIFLGAVLTFSLERGFRIAIQKSLFVLGTQSLLIFGGYLVWREVKQSFYDGSRSLFQDFIRVCVVLLMILGHSNTIAYLYLVGENPHWYSMLSYACFGIYTQFLIGFVFFINLKWVIQKCLAMKIVTNGRTSRIPLALSLGYALMIGLIGVYNSSQPPHIKHIEIPISGLPKSMDGFRIVQLCDIHLGPTVGRDQLQTAVDMSNRMHPDMVVIVGDLVDDSVDVLTAAVEPARHLEAKAGKFFVTGNHEYYTADVDNWFQHLETLGFTILHNANVRISNPQQPQDAFCLAGTDDIQANSLRRVLPETRYGGRHGMDLDRAVASCDPEHPIVLLAHQPKAARLALESQYHIDLVLSGHTHGGQFFPMSILVYIVNYPFYAGLYQHGSGYMYISEGTVYWGIPMRIGSRNEITEITLRSV